MRTAHRKRRWLYNSAAQGDRLSPSLSISSQGFSSFPADKSVCGGGLYTLERDSKKAVGGTQTSSNNKATFTVTPATLRKRLEWLFGPYSISSDYDQFRIRGNSAASPEEKFGTRDGKHPIISGWRSHVRNLCWERDILLVRCQHHVPASPSLHQTRHHHPVQGSTPFRVGGGGLRNHHQHTNSRRFPSADTDTTSSILSGEMTVTKSFIWSHIQRHLCDGAFGNFGLGGELPSQSTPQEMCGTSSAILSEWSTPPTFDLFVRSGKNQNEAYPLSRRENRFTDQMAFHKPHRLNGEEWCRVGVFHAIPALPLPPVNFSVPCYHSRGNETQEQAVISGSVLSLADIMRFWGLLDPGMRELTQDGVADGNANSSSDSTAFSFPPPLSLTARSKTDRGLQSITDRRHTCFRQSNCTEEVSNAQSRLVPTHDRSKDVLGSCNSSASDENNSPNNIKESPPSVSGGITRVSALPRHLRPSFNEVSYTDLLQRIREEEKAEESSATRKAPLPSSSPPSSAANRMSRSILRRRGVGVLLLLPPPSSRSLISQCPETFFVAGGSPPSSEVLPEDFKTATETAPRSSTREFRSKKKSPSCPLRDSPSRKGKGSRTKNYTLTMSPSLSAGWGTSVCFSMLWWCSSHTAVGRQHDSKHGKSVSGHVFRAFHHFPTVAPLFEYHRPSSNSITPIPSTQRTTSESVPLHSNEFSGFPSSFLVYAAPEVVGMWLENLWQGGYGNGELPSTTGATAVASLPSPPPPPAPSTRRQPSIGARKRSKPRASAKGGEQHRQLYGSTEPLPSTWTHTPSVTRDPSTTGPPPAFLSSVKEVALKHSCLFLPSLSTPASATLLERMMKSRYGEDDQEDDMDTEWDEGGKTSLDLLSVDMRSDHTARRNILHRRWLNEEKDFWSRNLILAYVKQQQQEEEESLTQSGGERKKDPEEMDLDQAQLKSIQFSCFPLCSQLLRNRRWLREPYTLAQEMEYGLIEMM